MSESKAAAWTQQVCVLFGLWSSQSTCVLNSPWHLGPLFPWCLCVEEVGRVGNTGKCWCYSCSRAGEGGTGAAGPWWHVIGESSGQVLLKVIDEPGSNLLTMSLEGLGCKAIGNQASLVLLTGKKQLWECKAYVLQKAAASFSSWTGICKSIKIQLLGKTG